MLRPALMLTMTLAATTLVSTFAHADVYRFTDDKGQTQYTDKPQLLPAERLRVQSQRTEVVAAQGRSDAATAASPTNKANAADAKQASELSAKDKAERCVKARERYDQYMNSQRLYKTLPNGERSYLTDAEMDQARVSAKVSMEEFCK